MLQHTKRCDEGTPDHGVIQGGAFEEEEQESPGLQLCVPSTACGGEGFLERADRELFRENFRFN